MSVLHVGPKAMGKYTKKAGVETNENFVFTFGYFRLYLISFKYNGNFSALVVALCVLA